MSYIRRAVEKAEGWYVAYMRWCDTEVGEWVTSAAVILAMIAVFIFVLIVTGD